MLKTFKQLLWIVAVLLTFVGMWGCSAQNDGAQDGQTTREVVDLAGRTVTVSTNPQKVATMQGPTYEMLFALGATEQIGLIRDDHATAYPLALLTNPEITNYPTIEGVGPQSPVNIEEFVNKGVDLVIYWNIPQELEKFERAGIPAVVVAEPNLKATNLEEALASTTEPLALLADILGGEAPQRYAEWESYLHKTVAFIAERTANIPEEQRPTVYWGNTWGTSILSTYPINPREFIVDLCGGKLMGVDEKAQFPQISKEQLVSWAPDVIIVDNHGRNPETVIAELQNSADWSSLPAVKNNRISRIPAGVFFMDKGTSNALYYYWLAKELHPDLFQDVDLVKELKYYYQTFYSYDLSTEEAEKVLAGWVMNE